MTRKTNSPMRGSGLGAGLNFCDDAHKDSRRTNQLSAVHSTHSLNCFTIMQYLAIMKILPDVTREKIMSFNKPETVKTWEMAKADVLRTIWFIPGEPLPAGTVALLECASQQEVEAHCREFPFLINGIAGLEVIALAPCTAYEMLFQKEYRP